mgnify:CR=1 FL=1
MISAETRGCGARNNNRAEKSHMLHQKLIILGDSVYRAYWLFLMCGFAGFFDGIFIVQTKKWNGCPVLPRIAGCDPVETISTRMHLCLT